MTEQSTNRVHRSFWLIGAIALIWNVLGAINFIVQMNADSFDAYREAERAIIEGRPVWATTSFALAVFGGSIGCLLLLLKISAAFYLFIASFLGVMITMVHSFSADIEFGTGEILGIILIPLIVAAFLIWYSKHAENKGWLK